MLQIYDGSNPTLLVDLDDGITAAIARGGWSQRGPGQPTAGVWPDVEETIRVSLLTESNLIYQRLNLLAGRAEAVQSPTHPDHLNPAKHVILKVQMPDEGPGYRWALVRSIQIEKLDPSHWRAGGRTTLEIKLLREGLWRGSDPALTKTLVYGETEVFTTPIDLHPVYMEGDAPPLLRITLTTDSRPTEVAITHYGTWLAADDPPAFTPYRFAATLHEFGGGSIVDITSLPAEFQTADQLPGGECLTPPSGPSASFWRVRAQDLIGTFSAYALVMSDGNNGEISFIANDDMGSDGELERVALAQYLPLPRWRIVPLGTANLLAWPAYGAEIDAYYYVGVRINKTGGGVYLGGLVLLPEPDIAPQRVVVESAIPLILDGDVQRSWQTDSFGALLPTLHPQPSGPFQSITPGPGLKNRLYFIPCAGSFPAAATTWQVIVQAAYRWQHLRPEEE